MDRSATVRAFESVFWFHNIDEGVRVSLSGRGNPEDLL